MAVLVGAKAYNSSDISVPDSTSTALALNSENYDTDTIHDTSTNNSHLSCQTAGKYLIVGHVDYAKTSGGRRLINITLNGATIIAVSENGSVADNTAFPRLVVATIYDLSVGDYVELIAYQTSGGALNVEANDFSPIFQMHRIG